MRKREREIEREMERERDREGEIERERERERDREREREIERVVCTLYGFSGDTKNLVFRERKRYRYIYICEKVEGCNDFGFTSLHG